MANRTKLTVRRQQKFLTQLALGNTVMAAARSIGVAPVTVYEHRKTDAAFAAAWEEALELGIQAMEQEAMRRAVHGTKKMVVSAGKILGTDIQHSDGLLMFLLKAKRPAVYRDTVNIELHIRQAAIDAGVDPDAAVAEAQAILKESRGSSPGR